jgi:hypothetical protein
MRVFERRVVRNMSGPIGNQDGTCRIRTKDEIDLLIGNADILRCIKTKSKMDWA